LIVLFIRERGGSGDRDLDFSIRLPQRLDAFQGRLSPLTLLVGLNVPRTTLRIQDQSRSIDWRHISRLIVLIKDLMCFEKPG
jgi:hypothetical protein